MESIAPVPATPSATYIRIDSASAFSGVFITFEAAGFGPPSFTMFSLAQLQVSAANATININFFVFINLYVVTFIAILHCRCDETSR